MGGTKQGLTEDMRLELAERGYDDPVWFLHFFLPAWFPDKVPWFHMGLLALLLDKTDFILKHLNDRDLDKLIRHFVWRDDPDDETSPEHSMFVLQEVLGPDGTRIRSLQLRKRRHCAIIMPRGFSKTTIANAALLYSIVYRTVSFIVYLSETGPHSVQQLENVKNELISNQRLIDVFGNLKPEQRSGTGKWTEGHIQLTNGIAVIAKGRGSQVRGLNVKAKRPDKIIIDDVEDDESVSTPEQRAKARKWLFAAVIPALPRRNMKANILMMGTLLHEDSLLRTASRDPKFSSCRLGAVDRDGDPLWKEHMSLQQIEVEKLSYARAGELATFYREFMSVLRADETQKFRKEFFVIVRLMPSEVSQKAICIDPSISDKETADYCAFAVAGMRDNGQIHLFHAEGHIGLTPREQVDMYFDLRKQYCLPVPIQLNGVESQAFQAALIHLLREEMFRKKDYFEITPITHYKRKVPRIEGILQPRYANRYITHQRYFDKLENQLLDWPNGKLDLPDVTAMVVALLDPWAAMAAYNEEHPDQTLADDQYEPLAEEFGMNCP